MNCIRFDELHEASAFGTDPLPNDAHPVVVSPQAEMDEHLAACERCRARLQNYVVTTQVLRSLGGPERLASAPPLSESLVLRILGALRAARLADERGSATA